MSLHQRRRLPTARSAARGQDYGDDDRCDEEEGRMMLAVG